MGVSQERASDIERRLTVSIPASEIDQKVSFKAEEVAKNARIKGFRKGRVPLKEINRRYGASLRQEVVSEAIESSFREAVISQSLKHVGQPKIDLKKNEPGQDLEFVVTVEVFPTVIIDQFEGVSVVKKAAEITDLDIESMIVKLQKQRAEWQSVLDSDVSLEGDRLKIDFSGLIDGKPFEGGSGENVQLELGSKTFIPGFEDQLIGLKQGYEGSITVTFPEDYVETSLRGKVAEFNTTIKNIERKKLPEVDKEFIKTFSISSGDIDEFRKYVKENMHREMVTRTEQLARNQLLDQLIAKHPFEVPKALVHHQLQFEKQQFNQQMGGQLNEEILAKIFNDNEELSKKALLTVKRALIVDCMTGQLASRDVTDEEREKKASELVVGLENAEEVKQWYFSNKKAKNNLDHLILEDKSFDLLFSKVSVEIQTLPYDEVMALSN